MIKITSFDESLLHHSDEDLYAIKDEIAKMVISLSDKYDKIERTNKIKAQLQQKNYVIIRKIERNEARGIIGTSLEMMPLKKAIETLESDLGPFADDNKLYHYKLWEKDGYDIHTTKELCLKV